jgi:hypothetical protein
MEKQDREEGKGRETMIQQLRLEVEELEEGSGVRGRVPGRRKGERGEGRCRQSA